MIDKTRFYAATFGKDYEHIIEKYEAGMEIDSFCQSVMLDDKDENIQEIAESVKIGISKINISSDIKFAFYKKCREVLAENPKWIEPNAIYPPCIKAMREVVEFKMNLFNDIGKASLYR